MEIIERERYLNLIRQWIGKDLIIVLTGQRRVGKSCVRRKDVERRQCNIYRQGKT